MVWFPDELWRLIKAFQIQHRKHHQVRSAGYLKDIDGLYGTIYKRWVQFPPYASTDDILRAEYFHWRTDSGPPPGLPLVSITYNIKSNGGYYAGYGWTKNPYYTRKR